MTVQSAFERLANRKIFRSLSQIAAWTFFLFYLYSFFVKIFVFLSPRNVHFVSTILANPSLSRFYIFSILEVLNKFLLVTLAALSRFFVNHFSTSMI